MGKYEPALSPLFSFAIASCLHQTYSDFYLLLNFHTQIRSLFDIDYQDEINYELVDHECCFNGVYVRGSRYCDFKIRLYLDSSSAGSTTNQTSSKPLLVELQRVHRDSCGIVFKQIFGAVKRCINSSHSFSEASPHSTAEIPEEGEIGTHGLAIDVSSNDFSSCSQLSEDEIVLSIQQVNNPL